jgi:hypothetical protein
MKKLIVISTLLFSLGATSCRTRAVVTTRPAPPMGVVRPAAPRPDYVWIDGEWVWRGRRYQYVNGYWAPPRAGHAWVSGHWARRGGGWYWQRGHWR